MLLVAHSNDSLAGVTHGSPFDQSAQARPVFYQRQSRCGFHSTEELVSPAKAVVMVYRAARILVHPRSSVNLVAFSPQKKS